MVAKQQLNMITIFNSLLIAAIVGLIGWIYKQSLTIVRIEARLEALDSNIDSRIDRRVTESTSEFKELVHELKITLTELNSTVKYISKEVEKRNNGN